MELVDTIDGMLSADYKERFIAEYNQVKIRWEKLNETILKALNGTLGFNLNSNIATLCYQASVMKKYLQTLENRAKQEGIEIDKL